MNGGLCAVLVGLYLLPCFLPPAAAQAATVRINEVMASNGSTIADEDGDYEDWIELYNYGEEPVDLAGWGLSDSYDNPFKWTFPEETLIGAGEYLLVWASGKDRVPGEILDTGILRQVYMGIPGTSVSDLTDHHSYPDNPSSSNLVEDYFEAPINIADEYGQRMHGTLIPPLTGTYRFWISSDDNSALYLSTDANPDNAALIASVPGWTHSREWTKYATQVSDPVHLVAGQPYYLSALMKEGFGGDHLAVRWEKPGGIIESPMSAGHIHQISRQYHANYSIAAGGEEVLLTAPDGTRVDELHPMLLPRDVSVGRVEGGDDVWFFFDEPTPGMPNESTPYFGILDPPLFSHPPGFYAQPFDLEVYHPDPEATVRYTKSGDLPLSSSDEFPGALSVAGRDGDPNVLSMIPTAVGEGYWGWNGGPSDEVYKINVLRARAFREGYLPSEAVSSSYIVDADGAARYSLPVVSLMADYDALFGPSGLFEPLNYHSRGPQWEREVHIEWFEDAALAFAHRVGMRIHGGFSRNARMKSLRLYARSRYGASAIDYPVFPDKINNRHERLLLRTGGSDWGLVPFRDAFSQYLIKDITDVGIQHYRPVVVFINGEYWGIHNARDRFDSRFLANEYGIDGAAVDLLTDENTVKEGTVEAYSSLIDYLSTEDLNLPGKFDWVRARVDVDNFRDYHIAQFYYMNIDQPGKNVDFWRTRYIDPDNPYADGRWRWLLFDTDMGFMHDDYARYDRNAFVFNTGLNHIDATTVNPKSDFPYWAPNTPSATLPLRRMLSNLTFREDFITRFADLLNTVFSPQHVSQRLAEFKAEVESEFPEHIDRWGSPPTVGFWESRISEMDTFAQQRAAHVRTHMRNFFHLGGEHAISVSVCSQERGMVLVNSLALHGDTPGISEQPYPWMGIYFQGVPVTLKALPEAGHRFVGWVVEAGDAEPEGDGPSYYSTEAVIEVDLTGDTAFEAVFEPIPLLEQPVGLHVWDFEDETDYLLPSYTVGGGGLSIVPGPSTTVVRNEAAQGFESAHLRINTPLGAEVVFDLPTSGFEDIALEYLTRRSGQGAGEQTLSYSTNGTDWIEWTTYTVDNAAPQEQSFDFSGAVGVSDNPGFAVRITFAQADGGTNGNHRFDNVSLSGTALPGVNLPPVAEEPPGFTELIEQTPALEIDLDGVFTDPDGDPLTYGAESDRPPKVGVSVSGATLTVTPLERGEATVTVTADDGHHPPVSTSFRVLVYPEAHALEDGVYTFTAWAADEPDGSYPAHMLFLQSDRIDTELDTPLDYAYSLRPTDYHANDQDTIGYPYNNTGRTRINGLGEDGIAFINTGQNRDLGGALLALDTRNVFTAPVSWLGGTVTPNTRVYVLRLQYRVGIEGPFEDVLDDNEDPVLYTRDATAGHEQPMGPVDLPADALDQPYVQVLWRYYLVSGESGARAQLRLDDILVAQTATGPATALVFDTEPPAYWQSGRTLPHFSVRSVDGSGFTDTDFDGMVTLSVAGDGVLSGLVEAEAVAGVAVFEQAVLTGTGTNRLEAVGGALAPALSEAISLTHVEGLLMPRYVQGEQDADGNNLDRIPYAYRARIDGLRPNATYRYGNRMVTAADGETADGAGNMIFVTGPEEDWIRNTSSPRFMPSDFGTRHHEFVTDGTGSYTGWFVTEPSGNARFTPGSTLHPRILLNDGQGGEDERHYLTLPDPVTVIRLGEAADEATAVMAESSHGPRHFIFLYDNEDGTNRPLAGVQIEITGSEIDDRYADFYERIVATRPDRWGTLLPNTLPHGVRRVETRSGADGAILSSETDLAGLPGTHDLSGGPSAVWLGLEDPPVFLPGGDGDWTLDMNWTSAAYPGGADAAVLIPEPAAGDRNVILRAPVTVGRLTFEQGDSADRNRLRDAGEGHVLTFASTEGAAELHVPGSGSGFVEFNVLAGTVLTSDLLITVTNLHEQHGVEGLFEDDYGALRLREGWTGPGGLIKTGSGVISLTGGGKDYLGPTVVDLGVLRVTEPAAPGQTAGVTVNPGGQLRLVSGGDPRVYTFGGVLTLNSAGRDEAPQGEAQGVLGALRYDPGSGGNEAEVTNDIVLAGPSSLHVDGTANRLVLSGGLSGTGTVSKSGGGILALTGDSSDYSSAVQVLNGELHVDGALGSALTLTADGTLRGRGTTGPLSGLGTVSPGPAGPGLTAPSVNGLNYRFAMSVSGGPVLRLTSATPFTGGLNPANTIDVFLDVESLSGDGVFEGGFFTDASDDFLASIQHATWRFHVRDEDGETAFDGHAYSLHDGEPALTVGTAARAVDFGEGAVEGRLVRVGSDMAEATGFEAWRRARFTAAELADETVSGPLADPAESGVPNLLRYALGLGRWDAIGHALQADPVEDGEARIRHRRLLDEDSGVEYIVEISSDLLADPAWIEAIEGTHINLIQTTPSGDGVTEVVEYRLVIETHIGALYLRLKVIGLLE